MIKTTRFIAPFSLTSFPAPMFYEFLFRWFCSQRERERYVAFPGIIIGVAGKRTNASQQSVSNFMPKVYWLLPLDEAIASRAVFVIVSASDGRADGRKRFWSQLNNSKKNGKR